MARLEVIHEDGCCFRCSIMIAKKAQFLSHWWSSFHKKHGYTETYVPVCGLCFQHDMAMVDSRSTGARFAEVDVHDRCDCGNATYVGLGRMRQGCIACWRDARMLRAKQASVNFNLRLLRQLRKDIRGHNDRRAA